MSDLTCETCSEAGPHEHYPTTEGVRRAYVYPSPDTDDWNEVAYEKEFNLWLKKHDEEVTAQAEERIIKLITDNDVIGSNWWIALIKGEQSKSVQRRLDIEGEQK